MNITHAPLFAGINGFGIAGDLLGWEQVMHCEIDDFCQRIIQYYWPQSKAHHDIKETDFTKYSGTIDVLSGGFPCQPFSQAGKRKGVDDNRYLWPEYLRAIREIQPLAVVGENVTGILSMEEREMFFRVDSRNTTRIADIDTHEEIYTRQALLLVGSIIEDLEKEGYSVQTFAIPAAGVGAPHKRERIWFVAYRNDRIRPEHRLCTGRQKPENWAEGSRSSSHSDNHGLYAPEDGQSMESRNDRDETGKNKTIESTRCSVSYSSLASNAESKSRTGKLQQQPKEEKFRGQDSGAVTNSRRQSGEEHREKETGWTPETCLLTDWQDFPTQSPVCGRNDGIPTKLHGITLPKWRNESIKGFGNAVVPQVVIPIFQAIQQQIQSL